MVLTEISNVENEISPNNINNFVWNLVKQDNECRS